MSLASQCLSLAIGVLGAVHLAPASAQIYKWVDGNGRVHFGQVPGAANAQALEVPTTQSSGAAKRASTKPRDYKDRIEPIAAGDLDAVKTLYVTTAEVDAGQGRRGLTPAVYAASLGQLEILDYLAKLGADLSLPDGTGHRAMTATARAGELDVLTFLWDRGVPVDSRHRLGGSALLWAAKSGRSEAVDWLLRHGADVDAPDNLGQTPLMAAVQTGDANLVVRLLEAGPRTGAMDRKGKTAASLASARADVHILSLLQRHEGARR